MFYSDLVHYVALDFVDTIRNDCPSCETFSEFTDMMHLTSSEVKEEIISSAILGMKELSQPYPVNQVYIDPFDGDAGSDEFNEDIPYRVFRKDIVKEVNKILSNKCFVVI